MAVMVKVTGVSAVQTGVVLPLGVKQRLSAAAVATGEEANAAGTGMLTASEGRIVAVMLPKLPKVMETVPPLVNASRGSPVTGKVSRVGAAWMPVEALVCGMFPVVAMREGATTGRKT